MILLQVLFLEEFYSLRMLLLLFYKYKIANCAKMKSLQNTSESLYQ